jgi:hypothetical protein
VGGMRELLGWRFGVGGNFLSKGSFDLFRGRENSCWVGGWEEHNICGDSIFSKVKSDRAFLSCHN